MIAPEFIEQLVSTVSIVDVISRCVELKKLGRKYLGLCPFHAERSPSFTVYPDHYHCYGCAAHGDVIAFVMKADGLAFPDAAMRLAADAGLADGEGLKPVDRAELERQRARRQLEREGEEREEAAKRERSIEIWHCGQAIDETPGELYLRSRGLDPARLLAEPPGWPESLRWSADASTEPDGRARPALVVAVNDARTSLVCGLQRIFLKPDGTPVLVKKGDAFKKLKLSLGAIEGNAAQFSGWPDPAGRWGIAEGPETTLAAVQLFGFPVWSAISSGNMSNVMPPAWARNVTIFADNDDGGIIAAAEARQGYQQIESIESVRIITADQVRADIADLIARAA